ncbi:ATP-binding protein [Tumebacillus permanentifrigoris]|uniref:Histidine kinase/DNA gyrase B/HSP90-like ATPase n=1 Tax=Tumebacillus permanentifrigoris TaxID=378543 RepID=A0A316DBR3_9BACL|nr:ATP-binding protein [Tumebacillus permanentifrigoris]PWK13474.1 histidine kinase/DNA gyrase B/HSP90-like ATPase [Tumebacillus permanentifrigoris]
MVQQVKDKQQRSLRFGGISPVVLRELSGVYQPFVKAVKEMVSNSYDADADRVDLEFRDEYRVLTIRDDGNGMNPIDFVRDYIRIGKSFRKDELTAKKGRPRIGGKGIGFLAPARYCNQVIIRTKKNETSYGKLNIEVNGNRVDVRAHLLQGHGESSILDNIRLVSIYDSKGDLLIRDIDKEEDFQIVLASPVQDMCTVEYEFECAEYVLTATIDFELLFGLDAGKSLEEIENFCTVTIDQVSDKKALERSYTEITLVGIKDFVRNELSDPGKKAARNIENYGGLDRFLWNLSRILPVKADLNKNLPQEMIEFVQTEMDGEAKGYPIKVYCSTEEVKSRLLERFIIRPSRKMDVEFDKDLIKLISYGEEGEQFVVRGFLVGQTSTIFPAECRGILLRVKGVAIGEPTYFGLDQLLTGSAKVALSQISGEINILSGIDAINDINPGRDGFYKESEVYNRIKRLLVGASTDKLQGDLKDVIDSIILRSEINASINNFVKRYDAQRNSILEAGMAINVMAAEWPSVLDEFYQPKSSYELGLMPKVQYKADGKLAAYVVEIVDGLDEDYKVDYANKKLFLSKHADLWKRNILIGNDEYTIQLKHGKQISLFCEVNPKAKLIYINWDHPMKATMGDTGFLKHCLASVASALPQEQLLTYIRLITHKMS